MDECLDALCAGSEAEGLETARAREPSPKRVAAVCMRVLIVSSGNIAVCSVVPATAPATMCP